MIGFIGPFIALYFWSVSAEGSSTLPYFLCAILAYTGVCILDRSYQKDGNKWNAFQRLEIWSYFKQYFRAGITTESSLDSDQQYIFCSFPHGACKKLRQKHICFFRTCWYLTYLIYTKKLRQKHICFFRTCWYLTYLIYTIFLHTTVTQKSGTVNHFLTMTDCCNMLSTVHSGDRRDLCASVLFFIPILREVGATCLLLVMIYSNTSFRAACKPKYTDL